MDALEKEKYVQVSFPTHSWSSKSNMRYFTLLKDRAGEWLHAEALKIRIPAHLCNKLQYFFVGITIVWLHAKREYFPQ
jgi:hypothetical protein